MCVSIIYDVTHTPPGDTEKQTFLALTNEMIFNLCLEACILRKTEFKKICKIIHSLRIFNQAISQKSKSFKYLYKVQGISVCACVCVCVCACVCACV